MKVKTVIAFLLALIVMIGVYFWTQQSIERFENRPIMKRDAPVVRPDISVITVSAQSYQAEVSAFGAVQPRFNITLSAQVAGQVETLANNFETGRLVNKGDVLLTLENSAYRAAVALAEQQLAENQLLLLQEQRQGQQAAAEWRASGLSGDPDDLVLRKPQLAQAEAAVNNAQAQLNNAKKELAFSHVKAPFDALIVSRDVSPGSYVQAGTAIGTLYSTDRVEVAVTLSEYEWQNLSTAEHMMNTKWPVKLTSVESKASWQGHVLRTEQHLDGITRQRALIVGIEKPLQQTPPLNPGTFVAVALAGAELDGLWRLPLTSLSQRGDIWYVNADNNLAKFAATPVFSDAQYIYISPPPTLTEDKQHVLIQPLDSYLAGMAVNPVSTMENAND
ncbi:Membrane fusion protein of RND family multidrug efflux pump [Methylophaga frappieri]|uniref:Membrane fusion protein of RND family multidrug efflux pump n=1 Tax=Methylophaga frappieri (strain ATCC BAA-2434 / DSM 25690 / JAM7) TaxID=754477 RepID=I1YFP9_METFJ|nr:efflux RND transporter periplasmic adaptor subunit [Methylophaga frappieri]AFJ01742.1 Membrane fusion protein of RND family multidrug efflux pump [Methylophaga frappieri]